MPQNARTELDNLLQGQPTRGGVEPLVTTRRQVLPLNDLSWEDFERLCTRLVAKDHDILDCHRYGVSGDFQGGIDLIAYRRGIREGLREPWCYQCKRWKKMTPADLRRIVAKFTYPADHYVVLTTVEATAALRDVVRDRPNVDLWDVEDISRRLKDHADLVEDFFGPHWRDAFCGPWPAPSGKMGVRLPAGRGQLGCSGRSGDRASTYCSGQDSRTCAPDHSGRVGDTSRSIRERNSRRRDKAAGN